MTSEKNGRITLDDRRAAFELCLFCPSLCRHACPVATAQGNDTSSPWSLMSLAAHLASGRLAPDPSIAAAFAACVNCGACSAACKFENPVGEALAQTRSWLHERGLPAPAPHGPQPLQPVPSDAPVVESLRQRSRFEPNPAFSFVPGVGALVGEATVVDQFFALCQRLDVDAIGCGDLARLDSGYELWWSGRIPEFVAHARKVHEATRGARDIVVMSAETLYLLRTIYPRFGLRIAADMVHVSEFLLPLLTGAVVQRYAGRVMYHESCHLARHLGLSEVPREVLRRVLLQPLVEVPACGDLTGCCGGTAAPTHLPATSAAMASGIVRAALERGVERLVSFSTECVIALAKARDALGAQHLRVDHAVSLVAEAVTGDGAAA
jgi:Fe-S oxidoreductase